MSAGFNFDLTHRNETLEKDGVAHPKVRKTGTTIAGVIYKDGVVLGADTRATDGDTVFDKDCVKIHYIAPNIYCCGAGTAADTEFTTAQIASRMELHRRSLGRQSRVITALTMLRHYLFRYQGHVSAALVLGGVDVTGPQLHTVHPHGSTTTLPFVTMGSGSLACMSMFETGWKPDMSREEAMALVHQGICAGIFNDLGSGSNVDLCVITKDGTEFMRHYDQPNPRPFRSQRMGTFPRGKTEVLSELVDVFETTS